MSGINATEFAVIALIVILVVGPEKLPEFAAQLGRIVRELKAIATGAKDRVKEELGPDLDELKALDPRQYDPRRIVREALAEDVPRRTTTPVAPAATAATGVAAAASQKDSQDPPPFDNEAT